MHPRDLRDALERRPFIPFLLFASDGSSFPVLHPELCVPGKHSVFVGWSEAHEAEATFDRHALIPWDHISHLEAVAQAGSKPKGNGTA